MNTRRVIGIAAATALAIALPLLAAERLAVKTGQWQSTVTLSLSGLSIPQEQLDKMPPAQRAQMEQVLKQMGAGAPRTETQKSCITDQDLDGNTFGAAMEDLGEDCRNTQVAGTARRQEWTFQCTTPGGPATGRMVVEVADAEHVQGTMEMRSQQANMDIKFAARWLAANCDSARPD
jgi:hypothetical protein